jgi:hypothetical protein
MLLGKGSPQVATKTFQSGTVARWVVQRTAAPPGPRAGRHTAAAIVPEERIRGIVAADDPRPAHPPKIQENS